MANEPDSKQADSTPIEGPTVDRAVLRPLRAAVPAKHDLKRRWLYVGLAFTAIVMTFSVMFSSKPKPPLVAVAKPGAMLSLDPVNMQQKSWQAQSQTDIEQLRGSVNQLKAENAALTKAQLAGSTAQPQQQGAAPAFMQQHASQRSSGQQEGNGNLTALPPPPPPLPPLSMKDNSKVPMGAVSAPGAVVAAPDDQPHVFEAPSVPATDSTGISGSLNSLTGNVAGGLSARYAKNEYAGYLPAGSFVPVALLHGLDAASGATSQANPQPVLMRIQDNATLPGSASYQLKSCFVLGSAFGDLSAERVYVRLSKLSCVDKSDRLVLASPIKGYMVDSDGKLGLRGVLINRQGAKLAAALMAGFAQGLSGAFGSSLGTTMMSPGIGGVGGGMGTGIGTTVTGSQAMQMAGMGGISGAAQQLSTFYLAQAQAIFPVISVNAGRTGNIVIEDGTSLNWKNTENLFVPAVTGGTGAVGAH